jgi:hypothetical protein
MTDASILSHRRLARFTAASLIFLSSSQILAADSDSASDLKISGFISVVGGKIFSGGLDKNYEGPTEIDGHNCPCYTADWANAGVYTKDFSFKPESRAGIQATYKPNSQLSLVGQLVIRGTDSTPNLQWAYAGYKLDKNWEVQVGRKRIPLYYYSDFQDIGVAYPWVVPPPELYGWEATNYNGASLRYSGNVGESNLTGSVFAGSEKVKDSLYQKLYYTGKTEVTWKKLMGADLEVSNGPLTARAVYMQADVRTFNPENALDNTAHLKAAGIAVNLDFEPWFFLTELTQLTRSFVEDQYEVKAPAFTIGVGKHIGNWTPFINYARYTEKTTDLDKYAPQSFQRASITLRYDLGSNSAIKAQVDRNVDTTNNYGGNNKLFRISYDRVF